MRNNALKHTERVNKEVGLSAEQRDKVYATYLKVEQYQSALDQRFAVFFRFDVTNKPSQRRISMEEVGLFTIENGQIASEEFFYSSG